MSGSINSQLTRCGFRLFHRPSVDLPGLALEQEQPVIGISAHISQPRWDTIAMAKTDRGRLGGSAVLACFVMTMDTQNEALCGFSLQSTYFMKPQTGSSWVLPRYLLSSSTNLP